MGRKRAWASWLAAGFPLAGLSAAALAASATVVAGGAPAAAAGDLPAFGDCADLRYWYAKATLPHVTPWGLDRRFHGRPVMLAAAGTTALARTTAATPLASAYSSATGTNVEEVGVDEPDIAKTDGQRVVLVDDGVLRVFDVSTDEPQETASLALPAGFEGRRLLLAGDRAVVLGTGRGREAFLTTVDLADPAAPRVTRSETVKGRVVSARVHDGVVRIVLATTPRLDFVHPNRHLTRWEALRENRRIVREASARDWLPRHRVVDGWEPLLDCADVRHPRKPAGAGTISVLTMDPQSSAPADATAVAADGDLVYASADRLYVATTDEGWGSWGVARIAAPAPRRSALTARRPMCTPSTSPARRPRTSPPATCPGW